MVLNYYSTNLVSYSHCLSTDWVGWSMGFVRLEILWIKRIPGCQTLKKNKPLSEPEIDYSPKPTTRGENFLLGVKMSAVIAFIVGLLWIVEKYIF